jgi:uncharacterized protein YkwD
VLEELNQARRDPPGYAFRLEDLEAAFVGKDIKLGERSFLVTQEGVSAVKEAVDVLKRTPPRSVLKWDPCLSASAAEHVKDAGPKGLIGHDSSRGEHFPDRILRYVDYKQAGENISYGAASPDMVVQQLLIDDGVPDRGHRRNMLDPGFNAAGAACGSHAKFGTMCVIDFARE